MRSMLFYRAAAIWVGVGLGVVVWSASKVNAGAPPKDPQPFTEFDDWANRYTSGSSPPQLRDFKEGRQLAMARRLALRQLLDSDPERALQMAVPVAMRERLPREVSEQLENRVSGIGDLCVICGQPGAGSRERVEDWREVQIGGRIYQARVYGRRLKQTTKYGIPLHGIEIDGVLAVSDRALRRLEPGEEPGPSRRVINAAGVSKRSIGGAEARAEAAGTVYDFGSEAEMAAAELRLQARESGFDPRIKDDFEAVLMGKNAGLSAASGKFQPLMGQKKALVIRVDFSDLPGEPNRGEYTADYLQGIADDQLTPFFERSSFGKAGVSFTVAGRLYRMPQPATAYLNGNATVLHTDAITLACADHILHDYDRWIVVYSSLAELPGSTLKYGGLAELGGQRIWVNGEFTFRVVAHELGHTFGLSHANLWRVYDGNPVSSAGASVEYGDPFDVMGSNFANDSRADYNPWFKSLLGWIGGEQVQLITGDNTYRVYAFDQGQASEYPLALKVTKDATRAFWVGCRRNIPENANLSQGAYIVFGYNTHRSSDLLDLTTPGNEPRDAALTVGATVTDYVSRISISAVGRGGVPPHEYLDVQIQFGSTPPTISEQPKDVVVGIGQTAVFEIKTGGIPFPECQWLSQSAAEAAWQTLEDGDQFSGTRLNALVISDCGLETDGTRFMAVISNATGGIASTTATLRVQEYGVFTWAGHFGQFGALDGMGTLARLGSPGGLALDATGNLFVADYQACTIRKIAPDGEVTTFAGSPNAPGYADGSGSEARFDWPRGIAVDQEGTLYVADHGNSVIRRISQEGQVSTLAGQPGTPGSKDGFREGARFRCPWGMAVDHQGNIFVADVCDNTIRMITPAGVVTTIAGLAGVRGSEDGPGASARFRDPMGVAVDEEGNVYVADLSNATIRMITPDGIVSTVAGVPQKKGAVDGPAKEALFNAPAALAVDAAGGIYVADRGNNNIRRISWNGNVTTIASAEPADPTGPTRLKHPSGIAVDGRGVFVADTDNQVIRWIVPEPERPQLAIELSGDEIRVTWAITARTYILEATDSLDPNRSWLPVLNAAAGLNETHHFHEEKIGPTRFFRLRAR